MICYLLDFRPFQIVFFEGVHQFWASVAKGEGGREAEGDGVGGGEVSRVAPQ